MYPDSRQGFNRRPCNPLPYTKMRKNPDALHPENKRRTGLPTRSVSASQQGPERSCHPSSPKKSPNFWSGSESCWSSQAPSSGGCGVPPGKNPSPSKEQLPFWIRRPPPPPNRVATHHRFEWTDESDCPSAVPGANLCSTYFGLQTYVSDEPGIDAHPKLGAGRFEDQYAKPPETAADANSAE